MTNIKARLAVIVGKPGVGKTNVAKKTVEMMKSKEYEGYVKQCFYYRTITPVLELFEEKGLATMSEMNADYDRPIDHDPSLHTDYLSREIVFNKHSFFDDHMDEDEKMTLREAISFVCNEYTTKYPDFLVSRLKKEIDEKGNSDTCIVIDGLYGEEQQNVTRDECRGYISNHLFIDEGFYGTFNEPYMDPSKSIGMRISKHDWFAQPGYSKVEIMYENLFIEYRIK